MKKHSSPFEWEWMYRYVGILLLLKDGIDTMIIGSINKIQVYSILEGAMPDEILWRIMVVSLSSFWYD